MSLFGKTETVYVDKLHEWRGTKVGEYNLLDRVWITKTIDDSRYNHPHYTWRQDRKEYIEQEGLIIETCYATFYSNTPVGGQIDHDGWKYREKSGEISEFEGKLKYRYNKGYKVLLRNGTVVEAHTVKRSHGENQEVFDHMKALELKKAEVLERQQAYAKTLDEMDVLLKKSREMQLKFLNSHKV